MENVAKNGQGIEITTANRGNGRKIDATQQKEASKV